MQSASKIAYGQIPEVNPFIMCAYFYILRDIEIDIDYIDERERGLFFDQTVTDTDLRTWKWNATVTKM